MKELRSQLGRQAHRRSQQVWPDVNLRAEPDPASVRGHHGPAGPIGSPIDPTFRREPTAAMGKRVGPDSPGGAPRQPWTPHLIIEANSPGRQVPAPIRRLAAALRRERCAGATAVRRGCVGRSRVDAFASACVHRRDIRAGLAEGPLRNCALRAIGSSAASAALKFSTKRPSQNRPVPKIGELHWSTHG
jgi:hypothetical protein